jgi:hypothetical protein
MANSTVTVSFSFGGTSGTIPGGAIGVSFSVGGGRGGSGGSDAGGPGGSGGNGRYGSFNIPTSSSPRSFTGYIGYAGSNGPGGAGAVNGGPGGQNGPINGDGGTGGADGTSGWSGCGGGGGAAGAFYLNGTLVAVAAGGGAGGGGSYACGGPQRPGGNGSGGQGFSATNGGIGIGNGGNGANKGGGDGGGGGAGGGGAGGGGGGGAGTDCSVGGGGGAGGGSRYRSDLISLASQGGVGGNGFGSLSYALSIAEINSFTVSDNSIILGTTVTLSWSVSDSNSQSIDQGIGGVASSGSINVTPSDDITYTLNAFGNGGNDSANVSIVVYDPVVADIYSTPTSIVAGGSTTLQWTVTGDASGNALIDQGIGAVPFSANQSVSPTTTTTYTISASGPGGSDTDSTTVIVYQKPQISGNLPSQINYGDALSVPITYRYASQGIAVTESYSFRDPATGNIVSSTQSSTMPATGNDENSAQVVNNFEPNIPWGTEGPFTCQFTLVANGNGGSTQLNTNVINVEIDLEPIYINIPNSEDQLPGEPEVIAPEEEIVISDPIVIEDIDIPVEIKANKPIQVKFDDDDGDIEASWNNVRKSSL